MTCGDYGGVTVKGLPCKRKAGWGVADTDEGRCVTHLEPVVVPDPVEPDPIIVDPVEPDPVEPIVYTDAEITLSLRDLLNAEAAQKDMALYLRFDRVDEDGNVLYDLEIDLDGMEMIE
jgi:hypothetical protein